MEDQEFVMVELHRQVYEEQTIKVRFAQVADGKVTCLTTIRRSDEDTIESFTKQGWLACPDEIDVGDSYHDGVWTKAPPIPVQ